MNKKQCWTLSFLMLPILGALGIIGMSHSPVEQMVFSIIAIVLAVVCVWRMVALRSPKKSIDTALKQQSH